MGFAARRAGTNIACYSGSAHWHAQPVGNKPPA